MKTYKINNKNQQEIMVILDETRINKKNSCETYSHHGQIIGCYDSGCYSFENDQSSAKYDCIKELYDHFNIKYDHDNCTDQNMDNAILNKNELLSNISLDEIKKFIENWRKQKEIHNEINVYVYHDGHNWNCLEIDGENEYYGLSSINKEQNEEILKHYDDNLNWSNWNNGIRYAKTNKYRFEQSQWQGNFGSAYVTKK